MIDITDKLNQVEDLHQRIKHELEQNQHLLLRDKYVGLSGSMTPKYLIVGEAPGAIEEEQGRPFCGTAGDLFITLLKEVGINPAEVSWTNVMKVRPAKHRSNLVGDQDGNRRPTPEELNICAPFLVEEINLLRPKIVIAAGGVPAGVLAGDPNFRITIRHGDWFLYEGTPTIPVYHPSYLLHRNQGTDGRQRAEMIDDLRAACKMEC